MNFVKRHMRVEMPVSVSFRTLQDRVREQRKWPIRYDSIEMLAIIADFVMIVVASVSAGLLYHLQTSGTAGDLSVCIGSAVLVSALFISLMKIRGLYKPAELMVLPNQIRWVCVAWTSVFLFLSATTFALKVGHVIFCGSNVLFAAFGLAALILHRSILKDLLVKGLGERKFSGRNIVLITDHAQADDSSLSHTLTGLGFSVGRHFIFPPGGVGFDRHDGIIENVIEYIRGSDTEEIVVGADLNRWSELRALVAELKVLPFPVSFVPIGASSEILRQPSRELGSAICVELQRGPLSQLEQAGKRCVDAAIAGIALTAILPLLAIVALAIKLDSPGPILFKQQRCGFNGRRFQIRKFRTMTVLEDGPAIAQAQFADKRVTRLGKWLRRSSIDELPQLLNVLDGSMSLVGPRPHAMAHDNQFDKLVQNYAFRRRVRPGLTGWAQVNGCRGPTPTAESVEQRIEYDLWYIDNWSFKLDFAILLATPLELIRGRNAY